MAHGGRPGKGNLGDAVRGCQGLPDLRAVTVENIDRTGGQQVGDHLDHHQYGNRRLLRRFQYHAVTCGQCRRQFPAGHQQRKIPRDDLTHHTERFVEMVTDRVRIEFGGRPLLRAEATGEVAEVIDQQRNVGIEGLPDTLAVLPGFHVGQGLQVGLQPVGYFQQQVGAFCGGSPAPAIRRRVGRVEGDLEGRWRGPRHLAEGLAGDR